MNYQKYVDASLALDAGIPLKDMLTDEEICKGICMLADIIIVMNLGVIEE